MSVFVKDIDHGWKRIKNEMKLMKNSYVKVGVLSEAGSYATEGGSVNLADVATFNEYGTSSIPARPFMGQTFDTNLKQVFSFIEKNQEYIYEGKKTVHSALDTLGVMYKGKVQETFVKGEFSPNSPLTVAIKGSSKPLIDTGRLRASINYEVIIG